MTNLKDILKTIVVDEKSRNTLTNLHEVSGLFKICKQHGYTKKFDEFKSEFERLSKESGLSELSNDQLYDIAGGVGLNFKRLPSIALTALTLGGAISPSGFAKDKNINISIPAITLNPQSTQFQEVNKKDTMKEKLSKLKDNAIQKGKELTEKGIKFAKEKPGTSVGIATGVVGIPTVATVGIVALAKYLSSAKVNLSKTDKEIINEVRKLSGYKESFKNEIFSFMGYEKTDVTIDEYYQTKQNQWQKLNDLGYKNNELKDRYNKVFNIISSSTILKGLSEGLKFMSIEEANNLIDKNSRLTGEEKQEFGNLFYCWQTLLVRARALAIEEKNHNILPLIAEEMLRISNNYIIYNIVDDKGEIPKLAKELIDTSAKELELYVKLKDSGKATEKSILAIATAATNGIKDLEKIEKELEEEGKKQEKEERKIKEEEERKIKEEEERKIKEEAERKIKEEEEKAKKLANDFIKDIVESCKKRKFHVDDFDSGWSGTGNWAKLNDILIGKNGIASDEDKGKIVSLKMLNSKYLKVDKYALQCAYDIANCLQRLINNESASEALTLDNKYYLLRYVETYGNLFKTNVVNDWIVNVTAIENWVNNDQEHKTKLEKLYNAVDKISRLRSHKN